MHTQNKKAFTLVELIVVITILAILGTIAFISFQGYSTDARNSTRVADIKTIEKSLQIYSTRNDKYPEPKNGETVLYSGETVYLQGTFGSSPYKEVGNLSNIPVDPLSKEEYTYSTTNNQIEYEILAIYEGQVVNNSILNQTHAAETYKPKVTGTYNKIYVKTNSYYIPLPSLINSEVSSGNPLDLKTSPTSIDSFIITNGNNLPQVGSKIQQSTGGLDINLSVYTGSITSSSNQADKIELAQKLQGAYTGTILSTKTTYKNLLSKTTTEELESLVNSVVLGNTTAQTPIYSCDDTTKPIDNGYITYVTGSPISENQAYVQDATNCGYSCTSGYTGVDCETTPFPTSCGNGTIITYSEAQTNKSTIISNINNYIGCEINDYPGTSIPGSGVYIAGLTNSDNDIMVVSKTDAGGGQWGCYGTTTSAISATDGIANTTQFLSVCSETGRAPKTCRDIGTNWYLPAKNELNTIYDNKSSLGTFALSNYWSSTEYHNNYAWYLIINDGSLSYYKKDFGYYVRCSSRF